MSSMQMHTIESAPEASRPVLQQVRQLVGAIPNLAAGMAEAPTFIKSFFALRELYHQGTLIPAEMEALSISNAVDNGCTWCVAFHTRAARGAGLPEAAVGALRARELPSDVRLRALVRFARALNAGRGAVPEDVRQDFHAAGYTRAQELEVVLGAGFSLLANYAGHLIDPPLEEALQPFGISSKA